MAPLRTEAERYLLVLSENCIHWSLVGFPAISLYAGQSQGLPGSKKNAQGFVDGP